MLHHQHCFVFHLQSNIAEQSPLPDGLTILQMWEQAGLLPPNKVQQAVGNELPHPGACSELRTAGCS